MAKRSLIAEDALVAMLSRKNPEGIEILYDHYSSALYGVICRIVQYEEVAEDVLQETFLKIWNSFSLYDPAKGRLFTWMVSIARNLAIDRIRSAGFIHETQNRSPLENVKAIEFSSPVVNNPDVIGLKDLVRKLEPEYREIIDLLFFGGYTQLEAAEKLNIPLGTVKTRSRAALQKLRSQFSSNAVK